MGIDTVGLGLPGGMTGWTMLRTRQASDFTALTRDPLLKSDIDYLKKTLPTKATAKDMLADPRLQKIVLQAFGLDSQVGMTALMRKVLESDPADTASVAARMTDPRYLTLANALNYGGVVIPEIPALPSTAKVTVEGLGGEGAVTGFSGTFGGITVKNVPIAGGTTLARLAGQLQDAFRSADGGRSDISVTVSDSFVNPQLVFTDAKGRGAAKNFAFTTSGPASAAQPETTAGRQATAAQGGPRVTDSTVIDAIAQRYTQARFEAAVGVGSDTLRAALYAKRMLPQVTNWYSVIADTNMARVVRGALGLPDSFAQIDVDKQVAVLKSKMDIKDFADATKLGKLLDRFVARAAATEGASQAASGIASLIQPLGQSSTIDLSTLLRSGLGRTV